MTTPQPNTLAYRTDEQVGERAKKKRTGVQKLNINVSQALYEELTALAEENGLTMTEVVRLGIRLSQVALQSRKKKERLVIHSENGQPVRELIVAG